MHLLRRRVAAFEHDQDNKVRTWQFQPRYGSNIPFFFISGSHIYRLLQGCQMRTGAVQGSDHFTASLVI